MQNKNIGLVDDGWNSMHKILDVEMPVKKDKRRPFIWWIFGISLSLLLTTVVISSKLYFGKSNDQLVNQENNTPIAEQSNEPTISGKNEDQTSMPALTSLNERPIDSKLSATIDNHTSSGNLTKSEPKTKPKNNRT